MSEHVATISWARNGAVFTDLRYSRAHLWRFDGGVDVPASGCPQLLPGPLSVAAAVDPEEAFVAALASCHMLWFLSVAAEAGFLVDHYRDDAIGVMGKNDDGKVAILRVTLRPCVTFGGDTPPSIATHQAMHHQAHEQCFIASSVKTEVVIEPTAATGELSGRSGFAP